MAKLPIPKKVDELLQVFARQTGLKVNNIRQQFLGLTSTQKPKYLDQIRKTLLKAKGITAKGKTQKELEAESKKWFQNILRQAKDTGKTRFRAGYFYHYTYRSDYYPDMLSYYDTKPLIYMLDISSKYYLGLNFHWLSRSARIKLLNKMLKKDPIDFENDNPLTYRYPDTKSYLGKHAYAVIRLYIKSNIKKKIVRIPNIEMVNVINLRSEKFVGITPEKAWKLSQMKQQKRKKKLEKK